jgi:hypothetical protein
MARVLTKLRIDEVSAVTAGAGEGVRVLLMKRHDTGRSQERQARSFNAIMAKAEADDGDDAGGGDITNQHPVIQAARLLVASGKFGDHGDALDFLLNKPTGQALLTRLKAADQPAKDYPMDTSEHLDIIMKRFGPVEFAKHIVETGSAPCTEAEFVSAVTKHAHALRPELRPDQAFAKLYEAEESVRRAVAVAKAMPFVFDDTPLQVGGIDAQNEANDDTEASEAYRQLAALGQQRWPNERADVQFSRAFGLRPDLAVKAHRRPTAPVGGAYPMPR